MDSKVCPYVIFMIKSVKDIKGLYEFLGPIYPGKEKVQEATGKIVNVYGPIHEPHKLMNELIDFKRYVVTRKMKLSEWIRDFKSANSYVFWDSKDKMPCAFYVLRVLAHRLGFI